MREPEGYVDAENGYKYVYQYKDHLGNVRLSYKDVSTTSTPNLQIQEENNYYPFGLKHKGYNDNPTSSNIALKRKFGGNELQDELGLDWYDISARNYDPALGRWMNLDPLAEMMRRHSPYNYAFDNPVYFIDPDGMWPFSFDENIGIFADELQLFKYEPRKPIFGGGNSRNKSGGDDGDSNGESSSDPNSSSQLPPGSHQLVGEGGFVRNDTENSKEEKQTDPLKQHIEEAISLEKWVKIYGDKTQTEIALEQEPSKDKYGLPLGPKTENRYVINPYDGNVMDMRHVVVVGYGMGEVQGYGAEVIQAIAGLFGKDPTHSAFNPQDKYSNNIGASFFTYDFRKNGIDMSNNFGIRFNEYLKLVYSQKKN